MLFMIEFKINHGQRMETFGAFSGMTSLTGVGSQSPQEHDREHQT